MPSFSGETSGSTGSSTASTITSPLLDSSPDTSCNEQDRTVPAAFPAKQGDLTVSSMVVELSTDAEKSEDVASQDIGVKTVMDILPERQFNLAMTPKVMRTPSKRASQVFNFLGDRRERRKSMDLLQTDAPSNNTSNETEKPSPSPTTPPPVPPKESFNSRLRTTSVLSSSSTDSLDGPANRTAIVRSASALGYFNSRSTGPLIIAPPSPEVFRPLKPPPRPRNRSAGASSALRNASSALNQTVSQRSSRTSTEMAAPQPDIWAPENQFQEKPRERKKRAGIHEEWRGPTTSTPRAPKAPKKTVAPSGPRSFPKVENDENAAPAAVPRPPTANARTRRKKSFSHIVPGEVQPVAMVDASFERRYSTFAASLEKEQRVHRTRLEGEGEHGEKEKRRISGRKRGSLAELGLVRRWLYLLEMELN